MNDGDPLLRQLLLQLFLILLNAFFASAEIALISLNESKLEKHAKDGNKRAKRLLPLIRQPEKFLGTIQVGITLAGFLSSAFAADNFSKKIVTFFLNFNLPLSPQVLRTISIVLITVILSVITIILGELVPKRIAMKKSERLAYAISFFIVIISKLFFPVVWFLSKTSNGILFLLGINPNEKEESATEEDIRLMVDAGSAKGNIEQSEKEIIHNVFEFDDRSACEVMTHRLDTIVLFLKDDDKTWKNTIIQNRHSHYPVCGDTIDDIAGVLSTRDYLLLDDQRRAAVLEKAVHGAQFVPESLKADVLLKKMKANRNHFAIVLDEYSGFTGIVSMNDLLESLIGEINDPNDISGAPLIEKNSKTEEWIVSGSAPLDKLASALDVPLPVDDYDTFAGFVFGEMGRVPDDGEQCEVNIGNLHIKLIDIKDHRLEKASIKLIHPEPVV